MTRMRAFRLRGAVLIAIAASSWPLQVLTINRLRISRPERVLGLIALIWVAGMLLTWVLRGCCGVDLEAAENSSFAAFALAMNGGPILRGFDELGYVILIACPFLVGWLTTRFRNHFILVFLVWGAAVALAAEPVVTLFRHWDLGHKPPAVAEAKPLALELTKTPDIFLVVFDGYPGIVAADQGQLDPGDVDVVSELRERGFHVPESSWSSYWTTTLSIPSLMMMNYPVVKPSLNEAESPDVRAVLAGENPLVDVLNANGYRTHMVESGWSVASCGSAIDQCVHGPVLDEAMHFILRHTVAWSIISDSPGPWVLGTLNAFEWLLDQGPVLSKSSSPDFVFSHVISPHPPFLLQPDCSVEFIYERTGIEFNLEGVSNETRERYLIEEMDCVDGVMIELADSVEADDVVIFVSDHGTDWRHQVEKENVNWDQATTVQRLNNFLAVRLPSSCSIGETVIVPNIFREVLDCLSPSDVERVPERMWINPMVELDEGTVDELLGMGADTG